MFGMTLRQFVPIYMKELAVNQCVDVARIRTALNCHILPILGERRLGSLKREDGIDYIAHRRDERAADGTIEREWAVLMRVPNLAVQNENLDKNRLASVPSPKGTRREVTWSVEDLQAMRGNTHLSVPPFKAATDANSNYTPTSVGSAACTDRAVLRTQH